MSTTLLEGHVLSVLEGLPAGHFHTVVCSPPYWQLRAYGTPPQVWASPDRRLCSSYEAGGRCVWEGAGQSGTRIRNEIGGDKKAGAVVLNPETGAFCARCGAWRGELGQEPTPELFVAHLVAVFEAVRRVLRDDGTLWVNLAGSYWSEPGGQNSAQGGVSEKAREANKQNGRHRLERHPVYKPLDWVDVPGLFARAMQAAGWLWRSDVVWVKPSALPESVQGTRWERCRVKQPASGRGTQPTRTDPSHGGQPQGKTVYDPATGRMVFDSQAEWADCPGCQRCEKTDGLVLRRGSGRPTKATERVLLFAKRAGYFFDQEAVREQWADERMGASGARSLPYSEGSGRRDTLGSEDRAGLGVPPGTSGRNLRDWWVIGPEPLKDAHYAAFPSELPSRCIRAGTSEWGCCPGCGAPWARIISTTVDPERVPDRWKQTYEGKHASGGYGHNEPGRSASVVWAQALAKQQETTGWRPTCRCQPQQPPVPCRVLDPFSGSGTTLLAANRLGRDAWGVELKPAYNQLARKRVGREPLSLFATHGGEAAPAPAEEPAPAQTKQERHPNRTVAGFNQRWNASRRPVGDTGGILPLEEEDGALARR